MKNMESLITYFEIPCKEVVAIYVLLDYIQEFQFYPILTKIENYNIFIFVNPIGKYYMPYYLTSMTIIGIIHICFNFTSG